MTLRRALSLGDLADQSHTSDSWVSRRARYDAAARKDADMYTWLESRGLLPPNGKCPSRSLIARYKREALSQPSLRTRRQNHKSQA